MMYHSVDFQIRKRSTIALQTELRSQHLRKVRRSLLMMEMDSGSMHDARRGEQPRLSSIIEILYQLLLMHFVHLHVTFVNPDQGDQRGAKRAAAMGESSKITRGREGAMMAWRRRGQWPRVTRAQGAGIETGHTQEKKGN